MTTTPTPASQPHPDCSTTLGPKGCNRVRCNLGGKCIAEIEAATPALQPSPAERAATERIADMHWSVVGVFAAIKAEQTPPTPSRIDLVDIEEVKRLCRDHVYLSDVESALDGLVRHAAVEQSPARSDKDAERADFEAWALAARVAYKDEQYGLCFYDTGSGAHQWIGWQARADKDQESASSGESMSDMVDAAMMEMNTIYPPLHRSECERLIRAALARSATAGTTAAPCAHYFKLDAASGNHLCEKCGFSIGEARATAGNAAPENLALVVARLEQIKESSSEPHIWELASEALACAKPAASPAATAAPGDLTPLTRFDFRDIDGDNENFVQVEDGNYVLFHEVEKLIASNAGAAPADALVALKPFAEAYAPEAARMAKFYTDEDIAKYGARLDANTITPSVTMGDFRRAHAVYFAAPSNSPAGAKEK
jgi:hypothetical protein